VVGTGGPSAALAEVVPPKTVARLETAPVKTTSAPIVRMRDHPAQPPPQRRKMDIPDALPRTTPPRQATAGNPIVNEIRVASKATWRPRLD